VFAAGIDRYVVPAVDAFVVDDRGAFEAGAQSLGITTHLFTTSADLLEAIEAFAAVRTR
jgi:hypothetical protein